MHRPTLGIIAFILILSAVALLFSNWNDADLWRSACTRVGLLMAAIWLAYPHLKGIHPKVMALMLIAAAALMIFVMKSPRSIAMLGGIAILLAYLRTKSRRRPTR